MNNIYIIYEAKMQMYKKNRRIYILYGLSRCTIIYVGPICMTVIHHTFIMQLDDVVGT